MIDEFIVANCEFFTYTLNRRCRRHLVSGFDHNLLTGEVDGARRQTMVDEFQDPEGNHFILLVSTLAGGVGLNLTAVSPFPLGGLRTHSLGKQDRHLRPGLE
jgi:hypothetical protein